MMLHSRCIVTTWVISELVIQLTMIPRLLLNSVGDYTSLLPSCCLDFDSLVTIFATSTVPQCQYSLVQYTDTPMPLLLC